MSPKEPAPEIKPTVVLKYVKGQSENLCPSLQQKGIQTIFRSNTTLRLHLVWHEDNIDPRKQDGIVHKIPFECGKV